jgi:hypothetical protein
VSSNFGYTDGKVSALADRGLLIAQFVFAWTMPHIGRNTPVTNLISLHFTFNRVPFPSMELLGNNRSAASSAPDAAIQMVSRNQLTCALDFPKTGAIPPPLSHQKRRTYGDLLELYVK